MSKQTKALANAERIADEAIDCLSRLSDMFRICVNTAEETYPEAFDNEKALLDSVDNEVKRLRSELEGDG
ncbi:hypothetical protein HOV23_gp084 [Pseudomonas phage Lana]|uniref:Uncharacterized protein n=1 Tax=Pseudomonas phage Lana TaxID=2530172 RepID=A0A481W7P0_9CAUD|nr:hypothetical protein HOV23_gp084 [Pseudomonas phage Lana]QBJ04489.1 hypothetical protein [Pseudomonas phage Lana]